MLTQNILTANQSRASFYKLLQKPLSRLISLLAIASLSLSNLAIAEPFTITDAQTTARTLNMPNEAGTISAGGSLMTSGVVAVTISSSDNTLTIDASNNMAIPNPGTITTTGVAHAIYVTTAASMARITNRGTISTSGDSAHGIFADGAAGATTTIINEGSISVSGTGSMAISGGDNDIDLTLRGSGFMIMGGIDLGGGTNTLTLDWAGADIPAMSIDLTILGVSVEGGLGQLSNNQIGTTPGTVVVTQDTTTVTISGEIIPPVIEPPVDPDTDRSNIVDPNTVQIIRVEAAKFAAPSVSLSQVTNSVHGLINNRMSHNRPVQAIRLATAGTLLGGLVSAQAEPLAWAQFFGGRLNRGAADGVVGYDQNHLGLIFGYEQNYQTSRLGLLGGYARSRSDSASFELETDNYYLGAYGHFNLSDFVALTASLIGGYGDNDNERVIVSSTVGLTQATGDYSSFFISPSLTLSTIYQINDLMTLRPSASVNYGVSWLEGYREQSSSTAILAIDDNEFQVLNLKAQLASAYAFATNSEVEVRVGVSYRDTNIDSNAPRLISTPSTSFTGINSIGDDAVSGGFVGLNLNHAVTDTMSVIADVEYGKGEDENALNGFISLEYSF